MRSKEPPITCKEKINVLQKVREGKLTVDCLQPSRCYILIGCSEAPGTYEMNGKLYNAPGCEPLDDG